MAGIYLHIPFCKQACYYCDFHFSTQVDYKEKMVAAIIDEIRLRTEYLQLQKIESIYFGGGTPSLLTVQELELILNSIHKNFTISENPEITLEANPDDLSLSYLKLIRQFGINRLSIGIQTFDDSYLKKMNRAHNHASALQVLPDAREAGFENISIDLMYALPNQSQAQWLTDLNQAIQLKPEHISAYTLTIEPKTVFGVQKEKGKLSVPDEDTAATFFETLQEELKKNGYLQYEVSNFCLPHFYSKHNSSYWLQKHYLGVGPSAHSYNGVSRQFNIANNHLYLKSIGEGKIPATIEWLSREEKINDFLLTGLRTMWGIFLPFLSKELNYNLLTIKEQKINYLIDNQLAIIEDNHLILTKSGLLIADKIASDLFV
ncbi:MAG: radical SAM family heme chaperone HemW [Cyclobacteriaceae bacterium]|jgi:oxygen-independent coproporphyrinogen-3 oxidase|nr:radical SAM family heme chaperone HemW [Cyclobacteriaceae bacterium]